MRLIPRKRKTAPQQAVETIVTALKLGAIIGAVKGATQGAGKGASKGVQRAAKRTPAAKRVPIVLAAGAAAAVAAKKLRSNGASPAQPTATTPS